MKHVLLIVMSLSLAEPAIAQAQQRSASGLFPKTTILYAEILHPSKLLASILDHPLRQRIEALEQYQQAIKSDGYSKFLMGRKFAEIQLGMEWREAIETLTAKGLHIGVDSATEGLVVLVHAKDAESLELFRIKLLQLTKLGDNPESIREGEYRGVTAYEVNKTKFAVVDDWLLITNKSETGKVMLDRLLDGGGESLADRPKFVAAVEKHQQSTAWGFADLQTLRNAGVAKNLFAGRADNPAGELLFGGIADVLEETTFATAQLDLALEGLSLEFSVPMKGDWISETRNYFFGADQSGVGPKLPEINDTLFTLSAYRDVSEMWLRAGDLFGEAVNDGLAEADANLTTFFSGKDFGEEILGALTPQIGFVASRQDFAGLLPLPAIKIPQFALVMELREPEKMTRELRRTFQSMIGFFNVIGAMEGRPQLEMDMDKLDNGAQLITSVYIPEQGEEESTTAPILFNFSPSVGFAGERFVVASTDRLARELVAGDTALPAGKANTAAHLHAGVLQTILSDNKEQLISQNMLGEGNNREEAEVAIGLLLEFVGYFEAASINLQTGDDQLSLQFQVQVETE